MKRTLSHFNNSKYLNIVLIIYNVIIKYEIIYDIII